MDAYTMSSLLPFSTTGRMCLKSPPHSTTILLKGNVKDFLQSSVHCLHAIPVLHGDLIPNNYNSLLEKICFKAILRYNAM
jgi:hypothetical protein